MKKFVLLALLLWLVNSLSFAQQMEHVVYLKNGGQFRGNIMEQDSVSLKIQILGGSIFVVRQSEVLRITLDEKKQIVERIVTTTRKSVWMEIGWSFIIGREYQQLNYTTGVSVSAIMGYQFNPHLGLGGGLSIDHYQYNYTYLPFYGRVTGDIISGNRALFYFCDLGYAARLSARFDSNKHYGGILINPGIGVKLNTRSSAEHLISLGVKNQFDKTLYENNWGQQEPYTEFRLFQRMELKYTIAF